MKSIALSLLLSLAATQAFAYGLENTLDSSHIPVGTVLTIKKSIPVPKGTMNIGMNGQINRGFSGGILNKAQCFLKPENTFSKEGYSEGESFLVTQYSRFQYDGIYFVTINLNTKASIECARHMSPEIKESLSELFDLSDSNF